MISARGESCLLSLPLRILVYVISLSVSVCLSVACGLKLGGVLDILQTDRQTETETVTDRDRDRLKLTA